MKPLSASDIRGTYATLLLPLDEQDDIRFDAVEIQLDRLIAAGVDGIYAHGSAGEFYSLSEAEYSRVNELLAQKCEQAGLPFQIGACFPTAQLSLRRARLASQLKPGAIQVILPDWYPLTTPEAIAFLTRIAEAVEPVSLVLYNPPHAKRVFEPEAYAAFCEHVPTLAGLKVGGGDNAWYERMRPLSTRLSIFVPGHQLATGFARGADGSYSNVACLEPTGAKRWNQLMGKDWQAALAIEVQIQKFLTEQVVPFRDQGGYSNMALDKLLASAGGWAPVGTRLRWPYAGVPSEEIPRIAASARQYVPFLFEHRSDACAN
jgi:4-hydroxy-tetrahydrodipicolinate synthase